MIALATALLCLAAAFLVELIDALYRWYLGNP